MISSLFSIEASVWTSYSAFIRPIIRFLAKSPAELYMVYPTLLRSSMYVLYFSHVCWLIEFQMFGRSGSPHFAKKKIPEKSVSLPPSRGVETF